MFAPHHERKETRASLNYRAIICLGALLVFFAAAVVRTQDEQEGEASPSEPRLHEAAFAGDLETLKELVRNIQETAPRTLHKKLTACYNGDGSQRLMNLEDEGICTNVLEAAAYGWKADTVRYLIEELGMDPNIADSNGYTALHEAFMAFTVYWHPCSDEFVNTVNALLELGADPNMPFNYGPNNREYTVLHFEAYDGNRHGLIPAIVAAGADVNAVNANGSTPLHVAAMCDYRLSCDDCGCFDVPCGGPPNPDGTLSKPECPEHLKDYEKLPIYWFGAKTTIEYLISKGANPFAVTAEGRTIQDITQCVETKQYVDELFANNRCCDQDNRCYICCNSKDSDPDGDGYGWEKQQTCLVRR